MRAPTAPQPAHPPLGAAIAYLLGIAGLAAGITLVFIGMRAVLDVGGFCAEGGPYVIETPCPEGVALLMPLGIVGGLAAAGVAAGAGSRLGGPWAGVVLLAWPALFGALGWNFLEYGFNPPGDDPGWAWGWIICGVVFWAMALGPLLIGLSGALAVRAAGRARSGPRTASGLDLPPAPSAADAAPGEVFLLPRPDEVFLLPRPDDRSPVGRDEDGPSDLVAGLERLAALRARGELTADEYAAAKRELLAGAAEDVP